MNEVFRTFPDYWGSEITGHYVTILKEQGVSPKTIREFTERTWQAAIKAYTQYEAEGILSSRLANGGGEE